MYFVGSRFADGYCCIIIFACSSGKQTHGALHWSRLYSRFEHEAASCLPPKSSWLLLDIGQRSGASNLGLLLGAVNSSPPIQRTLCTETPPSASEDSLIMVFTCHTPRNVGKHPQRHTSRNSVAHGRTVFSRSPCNFEWNDDALLYFFAEQTPPIIISPFVSISTYLEGMRDRNIKRFDANLQTPFTLTPSTQSPLNPTRSARILSNN